MGSRQEGFRCILDVSFPSAHCGRAVELVGTLQFVPTALTGICLRGRIEISERDITGRCSSSCSTQAHLGAFLNHGCIKISACVTKHSGWARWFLRCDICECDCHVPCGEYQ